MNIEELKDYVGVKIAELVSDLPLNTKTQLWTAIANWRAEGVSSVEAKQYILEWITSDYINRTGAELCRHFGMIHDSITFMAVNGNCVDLKRIAREALNSAYIVCKDKDGELYQHSLPTLELQLRVMDASANDYVSIIKDMKALMSKHAVRWINLIRDNPETAHCENWRHYAKNIIKDLMELDNYFRYDFDSKDRLYIKKTHGIYGGGIHYIEHIDVCYGEYSEDDPVGGNEPGYYAAGTQYFHVTDLDEAISIFIERILSGEAFKPQGSIVTLEDIKEAKAWQK